MNLHRWSKMGGPCIDCGESFFTQKECTKIGNPNFDVISSLRTGYHPDSANSKLADIATELADALISCRNVINSVNEESPNPPGTKIPGFKGAFEAILKADRILRKVGKA